MSSNWKYPPPGLGLTGAIDRFIGPGATRAEIALELIPSFAFGAFVVLYAANHLAWNPLQYLIGALLAFDIAGGIVTNATAAAKRWYHREGQGFRQHFGFIAVHFLHPLLVALAFRGTDWVFFGVIYGYLLLAAALILRLPLYLRRPTALLLVGGAVLLNQYALTLTPGMEWFVPFLFLKLLGAHLLREEPYAV